jgi:cyanoexosortase A
MDNWLARLQEPRYWLLAIAAALLALHLTLINRIENADLFATSILFWIVVGTLIWERRQDLHLDSDSFSSLIGLALLGFVLVRSINPGGANAFLKVFPFIGLLGLGLLASGTKHLRQYWKELVIFGVLALHPILEMLLQVADLSLWTAKAANIILLYLGYPVQLRGVDLILPTGQVKVYEACSGIQSVLQMLSISVLFLMMFPLPSRAKQILCVVGAVLLGFVVNAFRVALMAILNAAKNKAGFDYWHTGNGSLIFSAIAVLLFGVFCWLFFLRTQPQRSGA